MTPPTTKPTKTSGPPSSPRVQIEQMLEPCANIDEHDAEHTWEKVARKFAEKDPASSLVPFVPPADCLEKRAGAKILSFACDSFIHISIGFRNNPLLGWTHYPFSRRGNCGGDQSTRLKFKPVCSNNQWQGRLSFVLHLLLVDKIRSISTDPC